MERKAEIDRKTNETDIHLTINIDGRGLSKIDTGIPFMNHMLNLMTAHGFFDIELSAIGDTDVDYHHTVEDLGICLGMAIKKALGEKRGIRRYGEASIPMDESLARVILDISNRPFLSYRVPLENKKTGQFDITLIEEFFRALVNYSGISIHVDLLAGKEAHHVAESIFKAFGRALDAATLIDNRIKGEIPSTKGIL